MHLILLARADVDFTSVRDAVRALGVPAVLADAVDVPLGTRLDLTLAGTDMPDGLGPALVNAAVGVDWVLRDMPRAEPRLVAGDADGLAAVASETSEPWVPATRLAVHQGETDPDRFEALDAGGSIRLHQDLAVISADAAATSWAITAHPSDPKASLRIEDHGSWCELAWWSPETMSAAVQAEPAPASTGRRPDVLLTPGRYVEAIPTGGDDAEPTTAETTLLDALSAQAGLPSAATTAALSEAMSGVRAQQSVVSLLQCVPVASVSSDPEARRSDQLAKQLWLDELRDAVEMLGFETRVVDLVSGRAQTPAEAVEVGLPHETGTDDAQADPLQRADSAVAAASDAAAAANRTGETAHEEPRTATSGQEKNGGTRNWVYITVVVEMLLAAFFLFVKPFPWAWANLVVAAVVVAAGVITLGRGERRR